MKKQRKKRKKKKKKQQRDDYDSPWKDIIETYFREFMEFFFPEAAKGIDWTKGYNFLDKELQKVVRDAELGRRLADKLAQVWQKNGEEAWVLAHVEVQGQEESDFNERMFVYNYRIFDRYKKKVASLAILADENPEWKPDHYRYELWGCEVGIKFPVVKLTDYADKWNELEKSDNPFALVVMAHLKTQETRKDKNERKRWKLCLVRKLYERGYKKQDVISLFHFIDWIMRLPEDLDKDFWQEISQYEEKEKMPYISSVERIGIKKGKKEGKKEGWREGLWEAIEMGLSIKFGENGMKLMSVIRSLEDTDRLNIIKETVKKTDKLAEIKALLN